MPNENKNLSDEQNDIGGYLDRLEDVTSLPDELFATDEIQGVIGINKSKERFEWII